MAVIAGDRVVDGKCLRFGLALDDGQIQPLDQAFGPCTGQFRQGLRRAREEDRAAGHPIEAVDQSQEWPPALTPGEGEHYLLVEGVGAPGSSSLMGLGENSCGLGRDENPGIFEERFAQGGRLIQTNVQLGFRAIDVDDVAGGHQSGLYPQHLAIPFNESVVDGASGGATAEIRRPGKEHVETFPLAFRGDE